MRSKPKARSRRSAPDAIAVLKGDHKKVAELFKRYGATRSDATLTYHLAQAPALVRFEGEMHAGGPPWRIELAGPRWRDRGRGAD